jgi:hypothetical protein
MDTSDAENDELLAEAIANDKTGKSDELKSRLIARTGEKAANELVESKDFERLSEAAHIPP